MSEFGGLKKHENNQYALVGQPPKTECGCPSGGGIENGHIRYPSYGGTQEEKKKGRKINTCQNRRRRRRRKRKKPNLRATVTIEQSYITDSCAAPVAEGTLGRVHRPMPCGQFVPTGGGGGSLPSGRHHDDPQPSGRSQPVSPVVTPRSCSAGKEVSDTVCT